MALVAFPPSFRHHYCRARRRIFLSSDRPSCWKVYTAAYLNLIKGPSMLWHIFQHAFGRIDGTTGALVPKQDLKSVVWEARAMLPRSLGAA